MTSGLATAARTAASPLARAQTAPGEARPWARLAARIAATPLAAVWVARAGRLALVDAHAAVGVGAGRVARLHVQAAAVLRAEAPLRLDEERTAGDPAAEAWTFAGVPIPGPDGLPLGVLGIAAPDARTWPADLGDILADLGGAIGDAWGAADRSGPRPADLDLSPVLDATPDAFLAADLAGRIVAWNAAAQSMFGWSAAEAIGRPADTLVADPAERQWLREARQRVAEAGAAATGPASRQVTAAHRDGRQFPVDMVMGLTTNGTGALFFAFLRDVSDRVAVERALEGEHSFMRALLDSLDVGVLALGDDGEIVLANEVIREMGVPVVWSRTDPDVLLPELYHSDGRPMRLRDTPLARAFVGEELTESEVVMRSPTSAVRYFSVNGRPIRGFQGDRRGAVIALSEITDRRRRQRFRDCDLAAARALAGADTVDDAAGSVAAELLRATDGLRVVIEAEDHVSGRRRVIGAAGAAAPVQNDRGGRDLRTAIALHGRSYGSIGVSDTVEPLAEELLAGVAGQLAQFLERRRTESLALELSRTKDEFIALAGHSLRTPLTSIASLTELLRAAGDDLAAERDQLLGRIQANADALRAIVEDLLDLAGLESGHIEMMLAPVDLAEIVTEGVEGVRSGAGQVELHGDVPTELPMTGDRIRLRQVVDNLLSNAVNYSPDGGRIEVRLRAVDGVAELTVADRGIGIPPSERGRLFNRFFRGASAHERGIPGTGLGLALTRVIVQRHGGDIAVVDDDGPGTTFMVRLPTAPVRPERP
ncbi:hypothetical protein GCM10010201_25740 [Pilimelia columellifera subsp. columellifera]|uniref:histidine kinase n=2 Tax=Pilimelia TaxID=53370 RepID=A0ABP6AWH9_9ACTN